MIHWALTLKFIWTPGKKGGGGRIPKFHLKTGREGDTSRNLHLKTQQRKSTNPKRQWICFIAIGGFQMYLSTACRGGCGKIMCLFVHQGWKEQSPHRGRPPHPHSGRWYASHCNTFLWLLQILGISPHARWDLTHTSSDWAPKTQRNHKIKKFEILCSPLQFLMFGSIWDVKNYG